jgi:hypothetical protein
MLNKAKIRKGRQQNIGGGRQNIGQEECKIYERAKAGKQKIGHEEGRISE